jgi:hypothetical protein
LEGFGTVFKAVNSDGEMVAVKRIYVSEEEEPMFKSSC